MANEESDFSFSVGVPKNITSAIVKVMAGVSFVHKAGENKFHGYKYATEGDAINALRPHLIENGLAIISDVVDCKGPDEHGNTTVRVKYRIMHSSGEQIVCHFYGCGNDRSSKGAIGDKGLYKALTGANKYFLLKTFQLETGDDPERDENAEPEFTPQAKPKAAPAPKTMPVQIPTAPKPEPLDIDKLIVQIKEELENCTKKEEAKQVWHRYSNELAQVRIDFAEREPEVVSVFTTAAKNLL